MRCPKCGTKIDKGWQYCPKCGIGFRKHSFSDLFNHVFQQVQKDMQDMSREMGRFEKDIEAFDLSPFFRQKSPNIKSSGFTIRISTGTGMQPKVYVKTFGDANKEALKRQAEGMMPAIQRSVQHRAQPAMQQVKQPRKPIFDMFKKAKSTEEPKAEIRKIGMGVVVELDMPGVKSESDIEIRELENSVEVRAIAGDRAYFKILTKPPQFNLQKKKLEGKKLILEFE